jgi:DNA-binding CsgD family transcriptional regulator
MKNKNDDNWNDLYNFLYRVTASVTIKEFNRKILEGISSIIDFDNSAVMLEVDKNCISQITESVGIDSKWLESYNNHFCRIALKPEKASKNLITKSNEWDEANDEEYVRDFLIPQRIYNSAVAVFVCGRGKPGHSLIINRGKSKLGFCENDLCVLNLVENHLNNHYKLLEIVENFKNISILKAETEDENELLSPRESDIIKELVNRKKPAEIAKELEISIYTVRKHIQNIYEKLSVCSRHDLIKKITD